MKNLKKWLGALALSGLVAAGVGIPALSASAHTGDMDVSAVCNTVTGEYDFTVKLTITQTSLGGTTSWGVGNGNFTGTPRNANGMDRGPVTSNGAGTITLGSFSLPGNTTGLGPWVYSYTSWTDGYGYGSDDQLRNNERLAGDCKIPPPPVKIATPVSPVATAGIEQCVDGVSVDANGVITLLPFEGGHWTDYGQDSNGQLHNVPPGEYMFEALADDGYQLAEVEGLDESQWGYVFVTVPASVDVTCAPVIPPKPEPLSGTEETVNDPVCAEPLQGTTNIITMGRDWTQDWSLDIQANVWVLQEKVFGEPYQISLVTEESAECDPPVEEIPPTELPTPPPSDKLAYTGSSDATPIFIAATGIVLLGAAITFAVAAYRRRKDA